MHPLRHSTDTSKQDGLRGDLTGLALRIGSLGTFPGEQHSRPRTAHVSATQESEDQ